MARSTILLLLAIALGASAQEPPKQMLYRYVDASGRVYYTDRPPQERTHKPVDAISRSTGIVKRGETPLTAEEHAAREEARRKQAAEERVARIEYRRNVALLTTYPNEQDIEDARNHSLKPHQEVIRETEQRISVQRERREKLRAESGIDFARPPA